MDSNQNGIRDLSESSGWSSVVVRLTGTVNGRPIAPVTTLTDLGGRYSFTGLTRGDYTVTVAPPASTRPTLPLTQSFELAAGEERVGVNFGFVDDGPVCWSFPNVIPGLPMCEF